MLYTPYLSSPSPIQDEFLEHHGVLGMKWGVRREEQKRRSVNRYMDKQISSAKSVATSRQRKADRFQAKADKAQQSADKAAKRVEDWIKSQQAFLSMPASDLNAFHQKIMLTKLLITK